MDLIFNGGIFIFLVLLEFVKCRVKSTEEQLEMDSKQQIRQSKISCIQLHMIVLLQFCPFITLLEDKRSIMMVHNKLLWFQKLSHSIINLYICLIILFQNCSKLYAGLLSLISSIIYNMAIVISYSESDDDNNQIFDSNKG